MTTHHHFYGRHAEPDSGSLYLDALNRDTAIAAKKEDQVVDAIDDFNAWAMEASIAASELEKDIN